MNADSPVRFVESLLVRHRDELLAFARKRTGTDAEDIVQQASIKALAAADRLRDPSAGRAWLFRIVRRALIDQQRRAHKLEGIDDPSSIAAEAADEDSSCACVLTTLDTLSTDHAQVLKRVVLQGESISHVASDLQISANAATVRAHRARAALKQRLQAHCGTESLRDCLDCSCNELGNCAQHGSD